MVDRGDLGHYDYCLWEFLRSTSLSWRSTKSHYLKCRVPCPRVVSCRVVTAHTANHVSKHCYVELRLDL